jgi:hypothetical protein
MCLLAQQNRRGIIQKLLPFLPVLPVSYVARISVLGLLGPTAARGSSGHAASNERLRQQALSDGPVVEIWAFGKSLCHGVNGALHPLPLCLNGYALAHDRLDEAMDCQGLGMRLTGNERVGT